MAPLNDECNRAQDLVIGVATQGSTCDATDIITSVCGVDPNEVFYNVNGQAGASYSVTVSASAVLKRMLTCSMTEGGCVTSDTLVCSNTGACSQIYLVETAGACGLFTITATQL